MCLSCWKEAGSPSIVNDRTLAAAEKVRAVYEFSFVGGNAHVAVDDWNLDSESIEWCLRVGLKDNVHEAEADQLCAERDCLEALRALSLEERYSTLAIHDGYIPTTTRKDASDG